ncbi:hypothetical protein FCM35_KLT13704 [Carex littledalei]|uniref:Uncharacterized protein n=1 Tax=Carex littledalei TaxID=544730 RepID=A0A833QF85_9POAL|nr:hypothetical protein FCM35_KLT13704 [Carex littledalei]
MIRFVLLHLQRNWAGTDWAGTDWYSKPAIVFVQTRTQTSKAGTSARTTQLRKQKSEKGEFEYLPERDVTGERHWRGVGNEIGTSGF